MNTPTRKTEKTSKDNENDRSFDRILSEEDMAKISRERPSEIFTADSGKVAFNGEIYRNREEFELTVKMILFWSKLTDFFSLKWFRKKR